MKYTLKVTLYISELIYDVQNKASLTGRSRLLPGQNDEQVAHMQASDDEEDANQILRSIQNAFALLKNKLAEYIGDPPSLISGKPADPSMGEVVGGTTSSTTDTASTSAATTASGTSTINTGSGATGDIINTNDPLYSQRTDNQLLANGGSLVLSLWMPSNFNKYVSDAITANCHQFIVNQALAEWLTITDKEDAKDYFDMAQINIANIREAASKRLRPTRTPIKS